MDQTAGDSCNQEAIVDLELDGVLQFLVPFHKHLVEGLGLGDCTGETVEDEASKSSTYCSSKILK